ncbi:MAG: S9 family peptidase, partial [Pyrinomonadaceae bacterium]
MKRILSLFGFVLLVAVVASAQLTFSVNDLLGVKRLTDPQLSPDGKTVAYTVGVVDKAANRVINQIFTVGIDGSRPRQITSNPGSSSSPRWSPDGKRIAFITGGQVWTMKPDGDDKEEVTKISTGAGGPLWSPDGKWIAFVSEVYPECSNDDCNKAEDERVEGSKVKAHVTERLLFKHWVEWRDRKRSHVFVVPARGGVARDVTPGDFDSPPYAASSSVDYAFSSDGTSIAYLRNPDKIEATSTNSDIYLQPLTGGPAKNITAGMNGYDATPVFTSDGKYILFRSQETPTFEADRWRIMRYDRGTGQIVELTRGFDQQVDDMILSPDDKTIYFSAGERGRAPIFSVPVEPDFRSRVATHVRKVGDGGYPSSLNISPDGRTLVFAANSMTSPNEVVRMNTDGTALTAITSINNAG